MPRGAYSISPFSPFVAVVFERRAWLYAGRGVEFFVLRDGCFFLAQEIPQIGGFRKKRRFGITKRVRLSIILALGMPSVFIHRGEVSC